MGRKQKTTQWISQVAQDYVYSHRSVRRGGCDSTVFSHWLVGQVKCYRDQYCAKVNLTSSLTIRAKKLPISPST
jgi:hypothetical protein